eukprot:gene6026-biopygen14861
MTRSFPPATPSPPLPPPRGARRGARPARRAPRRGGPPAPPAPPLRRGGRRPAAAAAGRGAVGYGNCLAPQAHPGRSTRLEKITKVLKTNCSWKTQ